MENAQLKTAAEALGLDDHTLELVRILPLVYVAWSDGKIQPEELVVIMDQAEELGVHNDDSLDILDAWLTERPDEQFFKGGLRLLSFLLASQPESEAKESANDVAALCETVAKAAGGLAGHTVRIEARERVALRQVTARLNLGSRPEARKALADLMAVLNKTRE
jgi:tellurite resistance protein